MSPRVLRAIEPFGTPLPLALRELARAEPHAILHASSPVSIAELERFVSDRLAPFKRPRTYELVGEPLRDEARKVRRGAFAARSARGDRDSG